MSEKPIIFSTEMVKAILAGRKTQTRKIMNLARFTNFDIDHDESFMSWADEYGDHLEAHEFCPWGRPGDHLWVRESWFAYHAFIDADGYCQVGEPIIDIPKIPPDDAHVVYRADDDGMASKWRSPIYMPRWASRITLEVTDGRGERLQEITQSDAIDEGILLYEGWQSEEHRKAVAKAHAARTKPPFGFSPRERFAHLWDKLNAKRGFGWEMNPWVFVISFKRVKP